MKETIVFWIFIIGIALLIVEWVYSKIKKRKHNRSGTISHDNSNANGYWEHNRDDSNDSGGD